MGSSSPLRTDPPPILSQPEARSSAPLSKPSSSRPSAPIRSPTAPSSSPPTTKSKSNTSAITIRSKSAPTASTPFRLTSGETIYDQAVHAAIQDRQSTSPRILFDPPQQTRLVRQNDLIRESPLPLKSHSKLLSDHDSCLGWQMRGIPVSLPHLLSGTQSSSRRHGLAHRQKHMSLLKWRRVHERQMRHKGHPKYQSR